MVLAWVTFWLNTALFPCCEAFAAAFDDHSDDETQTVSASVHIHDGDEPRSEHSHHNPGPPCSHAFSAGPAINGEYAGLPAYRVELAGYAVLVPRSFIVIALTQSVVLALRDYHPAPPPATVSLYLQN